MIPRAFCISRRPEPSGGYEISGPRQEGVRWVATEKHLLSLGINAQPFWGIDWQVSGLETSFTYDLDHPGTGFKAHPKSICNCLSHILLWKVCMYMPDDEFLILEDDVRFHDDWQIRYDSARQALPDNWDMLFLGSCNCADKPTRRIAANLFHVQWPFCTHAYIVRKKALAVLDLNMQKMYAPIDIALTLHAFPHLNIFTILPRLADQFETHLSP